MHERLNGRLTDPYWQMVNAGNLGISYSTWGRPRRRSSTTSRPWPSPAKPATAAAKARGWATSASATGPWGRPRRRSSTTSRPWPSPAKPATAAAKAHGWATSATATRPWGRPRRRSSTTSRPWPSPARPATAAAKALAGQPRHQLRDPGADREGDRALPAGPGHRPRDRRPRQRRHWLGNLGECYADLGQTEKAIEHYQQALAIARETGNRGNEGLWLGYLGECYADLGQTEKAVEHYQQAIEIGDDTGRAQVQAEGRLGLAHVHLDREEWPEARQVAEIALGHGYRPVLAQLFNVVGIARLHEGRSRDRWRGLFRCPVRGGHPAGRHSWQCPCAVCEGHRQRRTGRDRQARRGTSRTRHLRAGTGCHPGARVPHQSRPATRPSVVGRRKRRPDGDPAHPCHIATRYRAKRRLARLIGSCATPMDRGGSISDDNRDGNGDSRQRTEAAVNSHVLQHIRPELGIRYT